MSVDRPFLTVEVARARVAADLEAIDAALGRLRETSTELVGNAFRVEVAERLIRDLTANYGMNEQDIIVVCLTFPIATGQEETRRDGIETIEAIAELKRRHPDVQTTLGVSNVSFGLKPAARQVLNSVFLAECTKAGLDSAIVSPSKIVPLTNSRYGSGRWVIREPAGNGSPRRYLPVSQPPASGLNAR